MAACLVYCVSRILFRVGLAMDVRCAQRTSNSQAHSEQYMTHTIRKVNTTHVPFHVV